MLIIGILNAALNFSLGLILALCAQVKVRYAGARSKTLVSMAIATPTAPLRYNPTATALGGAGYAVASRAFARSDLCAREKS